MSYSINTHKILSLVLATLLTLILFSGIVKDMALTTNSASAATDALNCVKGKNGISGNGCSGTVTLKLTSGGVINSSSGYGLRINNTSASTSSAAIYAKSGNGSGLPLNTSFPSGFLGDADKGIGVIGVSNSGDGVYGFSTSHVGVEANSDSGIGAEGSANSGTGIRGYSNGGTGIDGSSTTGTGIKGSSNSGTAIQGTGISNDGVHGISTNAYGVEGTSTNGTGVYGHSDKYIGVRGASNTTFAIYSDGDVGQPLGAGGWVKALARFGGGSITRCFNGQTQIPTRTAPCNFTLTKNGPGDYSIDFKFQVNNRFISVTPEWASNSAVIPVVSFPSLDVLRVQTYSSGTTPADSAFFVVVY